MPGLLEMPFTIEHKRLSCQKTGQLAYVASGI